MTPIEATFVLERLCTDGLEGLSTLLKDDPSVVLAGSYTVPWYMESEEHVPDIDLWIPFFGDTTAIILRLTTFLYTQGYSLPQTVYSTTTQKRHNHIRECDPYRRLRYMMQTILSFTGTNRRKVQLMILNEKGATSPSEVVAHFDLTVIQRYYDGCCIWSTPGSCLAVQTRTLEVNTDSPLIQAQTFPEWTRTLNRLKKYIARGYIIGPALLPCLFSLLPACVARATEVVYPEVIRRRARSRKAPFLSTMSYIQQWNTLAKQIHWGLEGRTAPILTLTVRPPGNTLGDVYVCLVNADSHHPVLWDPTNAQVPLLASTESNTREERVVQWYQTDHLIATLVPFVGLHQAQSCTTTGVTAFYPDPLAVVYDHIQVEERGVQDYIDEAPGDHFVVYGENKVPHTLSRLQLATARIYLPCRERGSADNHGMDVLHKAVTAIAVSVGTFYVPTTQLRELLDVPGTCRVLLTPTGMTWDCSVVYIHSDAEREEIQNFAGGLANNGGAFSGKTIHALCRLR